MVERGPEPEKVVNSNASQIIEGVGSKHKTEKVAAPDKIVLTPGQADKKAEEALKSEETKAVLDKMKNIENYINNIQGEELNSYKGIILEYKSIKDDIQHKMEEDPNFQAAMKQVGVHLDKDDKPLNEIPEPDAGERTSEILTSVETPKQIEKANYVISGYDKLNPNQQVALNKGLAIFKGRIEQVAADLGLNQ